MASISVRTSIRFLPDAPSEPTSTLVLTSPGRHFVDVRFLLPPDGQPLGRCVSIHGLDWAFAGTSASKPLRDGRSHAVWRHWVDSRHVDAKSVVDEGDMVHLSDAVTLETGRMVNPATGLEGDYEEVWRELEPLTVTSSGSDSARCVVLRLDDEAALAKGMLVLLGQFCQGVLRVGGELAVERWELVDGVWAKSVAVCSRPVLSNHMIPRISGLSLGDTVEDGNLVWEVVESSGKAEDDTKA